MGCGTAMQLSEFQATTLGHRAARQPSATRPPSATSSFVIVICGGSPPSFKCHCKRRIAVALSVLIKLVCWRIRREKSCWTDCISYFYTARSSKEVAYLFASTIPACLPRLDISIVMLAHNLVSIQGFEFLQAVLPQLVKSHRELKMLLHAFCLHWAGLYAGRDCWNGETWPQFAGFYFFHICYWRGKGCYHLQPSVNADSLVSPHALTPTRWPIFWWSMSVGINGERRTMLVCVSVHWTTSHLSTDCFISKARSLTRR